LLENKQLYDSCVRLLRDFYRVVKRKKRKHADRRDIIRILRTRLYGYMKIAEIQVQTDIPIGRIMRLNEDIRFIGRALKASGRYKALWKRID